LVSCHTTRIGPAGWRPAPAPPAERRGGLFERGEALPPSPLPPPRSSFLSDPSDPRAQTRTPRQTDRHTTHTTRPRTETRNHALFLFDTRHTQAQTKTAARESQASPCCFCSPRPPPRPPPRASPPLWAGPGRIDQLAQATAGPAPAPRARAHSHTKHVSLDAPRGAPRASGRRGRVVVVVHLLDRERSSPAAAAAAAAAAAGAAAAAAAATAGDAVDGARAQLRRPSAVVRGQVLLGDGRLLGPGGLEPVVGGRKTTTSKRQKRRERAPPPGEY
jgi:pyruvate/2-oxoglutarate dehydrogenase complex dihydrolipoamide acyltransferase (E2) component